MRDLEGDGLLSIRYGEEGGSLPSMGLVLQGVASAGISTGGLAVPSHLHDDMELSSSVELLPPGDHAGRLSSEVFATVADNSDGRPGVVVPAMDEGMVEAELGSSVLAEGSSAVKLGTPGVIPSFRPNGGGCGTSSLPLPACHAGSSVPSSTRGARRSVGGTPVAVDSILDYDRVLHGHVSLAAADSSMTMEPPLRVGDSVFSFPNIAPTSSHNTRSNTHAASGSGFPWQSLASAWKKPQVVALPPISQLGLFSSKDLTTAFLDDAAVDDTIKRFEFAIVGRMFGKRIPYPKLAEELTRRWGSYGKFRLVTLSRDCFVCFFDNAEARDTILMGGPWVLFGQLVGVDRWTPSFSPSSSAGFCTPVWIRMPGLPLYCWNSLNIARIAALVGEPLWIDSATDQIDRGLFARACVRIDLSKPLKPGVWIQGRLGKFFQALEYEGLSVFCFRCCQVGHKENACKVQASCRVKTTATPSPPLGTAVTSQADHALSVGSRLEQDVSTPVISISTTDGQQEVPLEDGPHLEDRGAGPWMLVQRKKRSPLAASSWSKRGELVGPPPLGAKTSSGKATSLATSSPPRSLSGSGVELLPGGSSSSIFTGFSALANGSMARSPRTINAQLARSSRTFKEKMVSDLGPVALGSRKRRKAHSLIDGGDASPSPLP